METRVVKNDDMLYVVECESPTPDEWQYIDSFEKRTDAIAAALELSEIGEVIWESE